MQAKSKKPKTIQIKYPTAYSQSWTEDKPKAPSNTKRKSYDFGLVKKNPQLVRSNAAPKEKVNKREKNRGPPINVTQMVYPLPPFQTPAPHTERRVSKIRKNAMVSRRPSQKVNRAIDPYKSWPPPPTSRPDPTAPHLKYGVFKSPKDKPIATKAPTTQPSTTPHKAHRTLSIEHANKKKHKVPKGTALQDQGDSSQGAVQVTRQLQLTISPPNHMDITPKEALRK